MLSILPKIQTRICQQFTKAHPLAKSSRRTRAQRRTFSFCATTCFRDGNSCCGSCCAGPSTYWSFVRRPSVYGSFARAERVFSTTASTAATTTNDKEIAEGKEGEIKMATDEEYMSFLDKANQDPNEGVATGESNGKVELKATDKGASVPAVLKEIEAYYVSDADEPFEPVCLKCGKGLPDEAAFAKLVNHPSPEEAGVEIMDIGEWDSQGQYKDVVEKVREASKGSDVRVYRIGKGGSRVEYWVVGVEGGRLVGVKALAIES